MDDPVHDEEDLDNEEIDQEIAEEEKLLKQARKDRKFSPLFCFFMVPLMASFKLKEMAETHESTGDISVLISKGFLYVPSIIYTFYYPLKSLFPGIQQKKHETIASFALRLLTAIFAFLFVVFEISHIFPCLGNNRTKIDCSKAILIERSMDLLFFIGLALFVFLNKYYPRKNKWDLFLLSNLLSAALYVYFLTIVAEEQVIYHEIVKRNNKTEFIQPTIRRRHFYWATEQVGLSDGSPFDMGSLFDEYQEMIYATICEFLVVAISIIIGIICLFGRREQPHQHGHHHRNFARMVLWTAIVLVALGLQMCLIVLNVQKANSDSWVTKLIFVLVHICVLSVGILACAIFHFAGNGNQREDGQPLLENANQNGERNPTEILDRYLLYFGTSGFFFYSCFGLVHSAYLIPTEYPTNFAIGSVLTNIFSLIQALAQTGVILHRDMVSNLYGFGAGITLWMVNFIMFCLDLFDAATLGIYSNPVPEGSNVMWTMFVRGLGPFDVFYRFHSLAIIAENIEHHLHRRQHPGGNPNL